MKTITITEIPELEPHSGSWVKMHMLAIPVSALDTAREILAESKSADLRPEDYAVQFGKCIAALSWFIDAADEAKP